MTNLTQDESEETNEKDTLEMKLIPLDRRTGEPVSTCIEHAPVALRVSVGALVGIFGGSPDDPQERGLAVYSMARLLGELFGAHVLLRFVGEERWFLERGYLACGDQAIERKALERLHRAHERSVRKLPGNEGLGDALQAGLSGLIAAMASGEGWRDEALAVAALALRIAAEGDTAYPATQSGAPPRWALWPLKRLAARQSSPREPGPFDELEEVDAAGDPGGPAN